MLGKTEIMKLEAIFKKMNEVDMLSKLFGSTKKFQKGYNRRIIKIGKAICSEKKLTTFEDCQKLSPKTELESVKITNLFNELCQWLKSQHPDL